MERAIIIKKFYIITIAICIPVILFLAFKPEAPLAIAKNPNKVVAKNEIVSKNANPAPSTRSNSHVVKQGESLYLISQKYGTTVPNLMDANGLKSTLIYSGQTLIIPDENTPAPAAPKEKQPPVTDGKSGNPWVIKVSKYNHTLDIYYQGQKWRSYQVDIGDNGFGDKQVAGDHKTPEGTFYTTEKSILDPVDQYLGSRWMRLSYPNIEDAERGLKEGIIDNATYNEIVTAINEGRMPPQRTALGGGIGIHGGDKPEFESDWTWGCVGLADQDIEEFFDKIPVGTQVIISKMNQKIAS